MTIFLLLAFALSSDPAPLVDQLAAPKFRDRERAEAALRSQMCWALAVRLESTPAPPEAARRISRLVHEYWSNAYPTPDACPYMDSLSVQNCSGCDRPWTHRYYRLACGLVPSGSPKWLEYRMATWLMLQDLRRHCVPPVLVRPLLIFMQGRSEVWDRSRRP